MRKLWSYFYFTGSGNRSVPVTEPGTGTSSGDRAGYRLQTVTEPGTDVGSGDRAWYWYKFR